MYTVKTDWLL